MYSSRWTFCWRSCNHIEARGGPYKGYSNIEDLLVCPLYYEPDNDVYEEQVVTMEWENEPLLNESNREKALVGRVAKMAIFQLVAHTKMFCERYGHIYDCDGDIYVDNESITVKNFIACEKKMYKYTLPKLVTVIVTMVLRSRSSLLFTLSKPINISVGEAQKVQVGYALGRKLLEAIP